MTPWKRRESRRGRHIDTCALCAGVRVGHLWRTRDGKPIPVCRSCADRDGRQARAPRTPCPRRCGPDGLFGPKCRLFVDGHPPEACKPAGLQIAMRPRPGVAA